MTATRARYLADGSPRFGVRPAGAIFVGKLAALRTRIAQINSGCLFGLLAVVSLPLGIAGGAWLWFSLGWGPDNSGGITLFLCGAVLMGILAVVSGIICRSRAVFYGLAMFTWLTVICLAIAVATALYNRHHDGPTAAAEASPEH